MRFLLVLCLSICAGLITAGDTSMFSTPTMPLAQAALGPGVDIVWGDTIRNGDPRFDDLLEIDGIRAQIAALDSLGFTLSLEQSYLNECRASKPGGNDTSDVEYLELNFDYTKSDSSQAHIMYVRVPAKGFESPALAIIETIADPGDVSYFKIPGGVDSSGNDFYVWMKYLYPMTSDAPTEEPVPE